MTYDELVEKVARAIMHDENTYRVGGEEYCETVARIALATIREALMEPIEKMRSATEEAEADNKRLREALKNLVERFSYYADLARDGVPNIEDWAYTEGSSDIAKARAALGDVKP